MFLVDLSDDVADDLAVFLLDLKNKMADAVKAMRFSTAWSGEVKSSWNLLKAACCRKQLMSSLLLKRLPMQKSASTTSISFLLSSIACRPSKTPLLVKN